MADHFFVFIVQCITLSLADLLDDDLLGRLGANATHRLFVVHDLAVADAGYLALLAIDLEIDLSLLAVLLAGS